MQSWVEAGGALTGTREQHELQAADTALAVSAQADQPDFLPETPPVDLTDTTSFLQGAKAIIGKAAWSVGRMAIGTDAIAFYEHAKQIRDEREAEEARELAHLAEWNAQMTMVGGVAMTNEDAQAARQRVIDHDETYAQWAVEHGYLTEDEKDDFKRGIRRKKDLEDRRGRGTITEAEEQEEAVLDRSRAGKAADAATAYNHQSRGAAPAVSVTAPVPNAVVRGGAPSPLDEYTLFQGAAIIKQDAAGQAAAPLAAKVTASGLNL